MGKPDENAKLNLDCAIASEDVLSRDWDTDDWGELSDVGAEMTDGEISHWKQHYQDRKRKWLARNE